MTEEQIERQAERMMDTLDREYLNTGMTPDTYEIRVKQIDEWVWMKNYARQLGD